MTRALRLTTTYERDLEHDAGLPNAVLRIYYTFTAAVPEQGPTWDSGGEPAEPEFVEFSRVEQMVHGRWIDAPEFAEWAEAWLANEGYAEAIAVAADDAIAAREYRDEMRRDR